MTPKTTPEDRADRIGRQRCDPEDGGMRQSSWSIHLPTLSSVKGCREGKILPSTSTSIKGCGAGRGDAAYGEPCCIVALRRVWRHPGAIATLVRSVGGADYRLPHTGDDGHSPPPKIPSTQ
jgi:hypothetical protein